MTTNTNAASVAAELIREMQENVAKYGGENTTTYLMVQAINELRRLGRALVEVRRVLYAENEREGGPINDTIWRGPGETLFDYIDAAIGGEQIAALASPGAVAAPDSTADAACILSQVCDLFHIGKLARTESTILTNVRNVIRFTGLLRAVERDLFPEPDLPEDEDDDPYTLADEGLPVPNSWGARDEADYVAQFRAALVARGPILAAEGAVAAEPALTGWQPIETGPKDGTRVLLLGSNQRHADGVWVQAAYAGNGAWIWPFVHANPIKWQPLPPAP